MPRVPRVPGRSIKLNPLPDVTARINAPAAAFGGPDMSPALKAIEALFEQTSNPNKPKDPNLPEIDPQRRTAAPAGEPPGVPRGKRPEGNALAPFLSG